MKLDSKTISDLQFAIKQELCKHDDLSVFEDYWFGIDRPDYPVKELRLLDINIFDGSIYGVHPRTTKIPEGHDNDDTGLQCVVYSVDENLDIDYNNPVSLKCDYLDGIQPQTNVQIEGE
tara:strand:- start:28 stop:384 length:357 start_codon:yes stop_codon:yes gene_type:complete